MVSLVTALFGMGQLWFLELPGGGPISPQRVSKTTPLTGGSKQRAAPFSSTLPTRGARPRLPAAFRRWRRLARTRRADANSLGLVHRGKRLHGTTSRRIKGWPTLQPRAGSRLVSRASRAPRRRGKPKVRHRPVFSGEGSRQRASVSCRGGRPARRMLAGRRTTRPPRRRRTRLRTGESWSPKRSRSAPAVTQSATVGSPGTPNSSSDTTAPVPWS